MSEAPTDEERDAVVESLDELRHAESRLERRRVLGERPAELDRLALRYVCERAAAKQAVTPGELATHLGVSNPVVTDLLKRLVGAGLIETPTHPTDRRRKVVLPTGDADAGDPLPAAVRALVGRLSSEDARAIAEFLGDMRDLIDRSDRRD